MARGVPSSSFLAYRFPIETLEASTLFAIPIDRNLLLRDLTTGLKLGWLESGTKSSLVGAVRMGSDST